MRMPEVMQPDLPEAGFSDFLTKQRSDVNIVQREDPVMLPEAVQPFHMAPQFLCKELRKRHRPNALGRLRSRENVLPVDHVIGPVYVQLSGVKVQIRRCEGQELPATDPGIVKYIIYDALPFIRLESLAEPLVLLRRPEVEASGFSAAWIPRDPDGVLTEAIEADSIIENG